MANLINALSVQSSNNNSKKPQSQICSLNLNTTKRIKPDAGTGHMLPSRIFGSPVNYFNNLKQDIVTIKKGANGEANDHELGRLNDLAMKTGSLLLAAYLFTTKPFKTSKAMEFVGFGSFFATMALWPKLAIQAPLKARTGVDIHQKYQDSQGRQKMFFQDPQYLPWDLVSQKQLDKMGKKLNIPENTPNRNAVIQERAREIAVQGNTLWMMTAGVATPVLSALACNAIEPQVDKAILKHTLKSSQSHLEQGTMTFFQKLRANAALTKAGKYIESLSNAPLTDETISKIAKNIGVENLATSRAIEEEITMLAQNAKLESVPLTTKNLTQVFSNFMKKIDDVAIKVSPEDVLEICAQRNIPTDINADNFCNIVKVLADSLGNLSPFKKETYKEALTASLSEVFEQERMPKVSALKSQLLNLSENLSILGSGQSIFDRFLSLRISEQPNTLLGNKYRAFNKNFMSMIGINPSKANITDSAIEEGIEKFVRSGNFDSSVETLGKQVESYRQELKTDTLFGKIDECFDAIAGRFRNGRYDKLARSINGTSGEVVETTGTLKNALKTHVGIRILGAESSFYRTLQALDLFKKLETGDFERSLCDFNLSSEEIEAAKRYAKDFLLKGTIVDYSDSAKYMNSASGKKIHNAVMEVLFNDERYGTIIGNDTLKARLRAYKGDFKRRIIDTIRSGDTTSKEAFEGITKHTLVGESMVDAIKNSAQSVKNSNKWLKIFGSIALVITGVTLIAGTTFGKAKKSDKVVEGDNK